MNENVSNLYEELSRTQWSELITKIITFDTSKLSIFNDLKYEVRKSKQGKDTIEYLVVYIDIQGEEEPVFIYEISDEYYALYHGISEYGNNCIRIKCDQVDGIMQAIKDLKLKLK